MMFAREKEFWVGWIKFCLPVIVLFCSTALVGPGCGASNTGSENDDGGKAQDSVVEEDAQPVDAFVDPNVDEDGDGYTPAQGDCDDSDPDVYPGATLVCGDGKDNNCNGFIDDAEPDVDGDGYPPCRNGEVYDCDENDPNVHPGMNEIPGDGIDNNCDGIVDGDYDGDGWTVDDGDCNDDDPDVYPGALINCYDGKDNNCNGFIDEEEPDMDGDNFGPCEGDCDDTDSNVGPHMNEIPGDGIDNNCDGLTDEDLDGDGWTEVNGDCDDSDPEIHPAAIEICDDNIDNNCNGITDDDCLDPCALAAAMRSSVGCVYYAVDTNPIHSFVAGDYAIAVSNIDETEVANVVVEEKSGGTWSPVPGATFTVGPLDLQTLVLPHRYIDGSALYEGGAYRITSDMPVIAYQFNPLDGASSYLSDASLLLPASAYDRFFYVPAWPYGPADGGGGGWPAHIQIVAAEATQVRVTSPIVTVSGSGVPALQPNVEAAFDLEEGDYLQLTVQNFMESFAGTYVESDGLISIFSSNDCADVPAANGNCCCDHLEEQIFGLQTWGRNYVASRVPRRNTEDAYWQILASEDDTTVTFDFNPAVGGLPASVTLNAGETAEYMVNGNNEHPGDFFVSADKPILVTQFMVAAALTGSNTGDPAMVLSVPVEQFLDRYVVLVPNTWHTDWVVLVRPSGSTVEVDGVAVTTGWAPAGSSGYEVNRYAVSDGVHVLQGSEPFGVIVVGVDSHDSYAYPGGLNQELINIIN